MGKEQRALAITLLMVLAVVLAAGLHRRDAYDDETVLAALDSSGGPGAVSMVSPRRLSIARTPEPATSRAATPPAEPPAEQGETAASTPTSVKTRVPAPALITAAREPAPVSPAAAQSSPPAHEVPPASPAQKKQTAVGGDDDGRLPAIVIDSRDISFERYLRLVESMGALFVLTNDRRLGPRVSLRRGIAIPGGLPDHLVRERPHVVTDPRLLRRLSTVSLPGDVRRDRLVLLLTRRADRTLWRGVADALSRRGLAHSSVALIAGTYVESAGRLSIRFDTATLKEGGGTVRLSAPGREGVS